MRGRDDRFSETAEHKLHFYVSHRRGLDPVDQAEEVAAVVLVGTRQDPDQQAESGTRGSCSGKNSGDVGGRWRRRLHPDAVDDEEHVEGNGERKQRSQSQLPPQHDKRRFCLHINMTNCCRAWTCSGFGAS